MTRNFLLAATVLAASAIGGAAIADTNYGHWGQPGPSDRAGMKMKVGSGMMGDMSNMMGMMQHMHGHTMGGGMMGGMGPIGGMMGGAGPMGGGMMRMLDADGAMTPEELRTQLQARLAEFDSDGDGTLSISEFEALHSATIREMMVDRFQHLDADGDGTVTAEEMTAPADWMERMWKMREGFGSMQPGGGPGMGAGRMMNDN